MPDLKDFYDFKHTNGAEDNNDNHTGVSLLPIVVLLLLLIVKAVIEIR